ncbi:MAG: phosphatidylglycerol lysyltransferase domain-containing protein, partial [Candidatus Saccharimonadales bacterium]
MTKVDISFETPEKKHAEILQGLNTDFQPYADTAYGTFLTWWDLYNDLAFAELNGNIIIQSSYPTLGKKLTHTIVGGHEIDSTVNQLFDYQREHGLETIIHSVPEYQLPFLKDRSDLVITHNPDISEYVLSAHQHANLDTNDFLKIRHKVSHFVNAYGRENICSEEVNLSNPETRQLLLDSLASWGGSFKNDKDRLEELIITKSLNLHAQIDLRCFVIFVKDRLVGFALYKILPRGYVNLNHLKVC